MFDAGLETVSVLVDVDPLSWGGRKNDYDIVRLYDVKTKKTRFEPDTLTPFRVTPDAG